MDYLDKRANRRMNKPMAAASKDPKDATFCLTETDTFFEQDFKIIQEFYMTKERNTKSVAELIFDFYYFYSYEFSQNSQVIDIKSPKGFSTKFSRDKFPFSIVDPFEQ